jgi:hypothetical protein
VADHNDQELRALRAASAAEKSAVQDLTRSINLFALNTLIDAGTSAEAGTDLATVTDCVHGMSARLATLTRDLDIEATLLDAPEGALTPPLPPAPRTI